MGKKTVAEGDFMRCIIITGTETSGTSCVSGMTHRLGINMAFYLKPPSKANPKGYYEDLKYQQALYVRGGRDKRKVAIYAWADERVGKEQENGGVIWGVKEPWFMTNAKDTFGGIEAKDPEAEFKLIHMRRDRESIARSRMVKYSRPGLTIEDYRQKVDRMLLDDRKFFGSYEGPVMDLSYEEVVDSPRRVVWAIIKYCFDGLPFSIWPSPTQIEEAVGFFDPALKRF